MHRDVGVRVRYVTYGPEVGEFKLVCPGAYILRIWDWWTYRTGIWGLIPGRWDVGCGMWDRRTCACTEDVSTRLLDSHTYLLDPHTYLH